MCVGIGFNVQIRKLPLHTPSARLTLDFETRGEKSEGMHSVYLSVSMAWHDMAHILICACATFQVHTYYVDMNSVHMGKVITGQDSSVGQLFHLPRSTPLVYSVMVFDRPSTVRGS
jgi:hypothetical protein